MGAGKLRAFAGNRNTRLYRRIRRGCKGRQTTKQINKHIHHEKGIQDNDHRLRMRQQRDTDTGALSPCTVDHCVGAVFSHRRT